MQFRVTLRYIVVAAIGIFYGIIAQRDQLFPAHFLNQAGLALNALATVVRLETGDSLFKEPGRYPGRGVTINDQAHAYSGLTFMTLYDGESFGAVLIDMNGTVLHRWKMPYSAVWPKADFLIYQAPDDQVAVHGAHLFPNGDVVWNYQGGHYPLGGGTIRLDRCSNLKWSVPYNNHHSVDVLPDGRILVSSERVRNKDIAAYRPLSAPYNEDMIMFIRPDGSVEEEKSSLKLLFDSGQLGALLANEVALQLPREDPLHQNDAEYLRPDMADAFPLFKAGDIMLSFRNTNTIAVIDGKTDRVKWTMTGPFLRQHDPDFLSNGDIMVFDNQGGHMDNGQHGSRIVEINPATQRIVWEYDGTPEAPFFTEIRGKLQVLPNNDVLVTEAINGRVFEVTRDKKIVWQYINRLDDGHVGLVTQADRFAEGALDFLDKPCDRADLN